MARVSIVIFMTLCIFLGTSQHQDIFDFGQTTHSKTFIKKQVDSLMQILLANNKQNNRTIPLTDSIIKLGKKIDYREAVCQAYTIRTQRIVMISDSPAENLVRTEINAMMNYAISIKNKSVYFEAWSLWIDYYTFSEIYNKAFEEIIKYRQAALQQNMPDVVAMSYRHLGDIYYYEGDYYSAINNYMIFIRLAKESFPNNSYIHYYYRCSEIFISMDEFNKALQFTLDGDSFWGEKLQGKDYIESRLYLAICYYHVHEYNKMEEIFQKYYKSKDLTHFQNYLMDVLSTYHYIFQKEYDKALKIANTMQFSIEQNMILKHIYEAINSNKDISRTKLSLLKEDMGSFPTDNTTYMLQRRALFDMMKTNRDSLTLTKQYTLLQMQKDLIQSQTEKTALQKEAIKKKLESDATHARALQAKLHSHLIKEQSKLLIAERKGQLQSYQIQKMILIGLAIFCAMLVLWLVYFALTRHKYIAQLQREDEQIDKLEKIDEKLNVVAHQAMLEAEDADRLKNQFIEHISHAVRTSLNAIVGFSTMLTSDDVRNDEEKKEKIKVIIEQNSNQLSSVVNSVLDLTNIQKGKYKMLYNPTTIEELTNTALHLEKQKLASGVKLNIKIAPDCQNMIIYTDVQRVTQSLNHLLDNAYKFTTEGHIDFTCNRYTEGKNEMLQFVVTNTGNIIPANKANDIFEPFIKLDDFSQGYGLGLSFCKEIARRLDGKCYLDNEYKNGARFIFIFPLFFDEQIKVQETL